MLSSALQNLAKNFALLLIGAYRSIGVAHLGGACRFEPSCSQYAVDAFKTHSPFNATKLTASRILKCRPGGPFGWDPVPLKIGDVIHRQETT